MTKYANPSATNASYQKTFASNLVESLGFHAAISVCVENCWDGTLYYILNTRKPA